MIRRFASHGFATGMAIVLAAAVVAVLTSVVGVMPASSQAQIVQVRAAASVPREDPFDAFWDDVQPVEVALSGQNLTRPMGGGTVAAVQLRAAHDGERLYILSEWSDDTEDAAVDTTTSFGDAAAVEFPSTGGNRLPSFCMGDPGAAVNIWHWRAAWQHDIDAGFATNRARYANMQVDYYPEDGDTLFQTGLAADNPISAREHDSPVENLVAAQFGTLTTSDVQDVDGAGRWQDGRWRVLFVRSLDGSDGATAFPPGRKVNAAFAVWNGSDGQRDGMKSVSQFVDLQISGDKIARRSSNLAPAIVVLVSIMTSLAALGLFGVLMARSKPAS
jgi:complex iron-sulfur molybdoenzyme family reductase subunit gamma